MCGLFGFSNYSGEKIKNLSVLTNSLARQSAVRGTDATGIAFNNIKGMNIFKDSKSAHKIEFKHSDEIRSMLGHTRHSTQGSEKKVWNNHPFQGRCTNTTFALAHNGVLSNDKELRKQLKLPRTKIETDSYIAVQLIESQRRLNFDSLRYMAERTEGSFAYSILDGKNNLWLVKGDSPLSILHFPKQKMYVYASTDEILYKALIDFPPLFSALKNGDAEEIDISEGEILKVRSDGILERETFKYSYYYGRSWWDYGCYPSISIGKSRSNKEYINELKSIAKYYGYTPEDIDEMIGSGVSPYEIEEFLYCGGEI